MRVNMHMLESDLEDLDLQGRLASPDYERTLTFAAMSVGKDGFKEDRLYVLDPDALAAVGELPRKSNIICVGEPPEDLAANHGRANLLWTRSKRVTASALADRVNELIASYTAWADSLGRAFAVGKPLRKVAELSEPVFNNPIWMFDSQLQTVFHVASDTDFELPEHYKMHNDGKPWPIEEVNAVNEEFRQALESREPHLLPPMFGYVSLCYNLFDGKQYMATLAVDNVTGRKFTTRDKVLIKYLGDKMIHALKYEAHFSKHATYIVDEMLEQLLQGDAVSPIALQRALSHMGWNVKDSYFCVLAHQSSSTSYPDVFLIPTAETLCDIVPHTMFSITDGSILLVSNLTVSGLHPTKVCEPLVGMLRKRGLDMKLGVSTPFSDFSYVRYFFDQAHEAIHLGERIDGEKPVYMFHDYILEAMIDKCLADTVPEALYLPGLSRLIRYDKAHDGDLVETLEEYLKNGMSMKKTSETLHMHRNTLLTRLKTIESLGKLDLDDYKTRVQLMMAFLLTEELP